MSKKAFVFSGQGSQFVGMGKDFYDAYPSCADLFDKADEILGYSISDICFNGPVEELTKTNNCQPGIFVMSAVCCEALKINKSDLQIDAVAGLSLGEWSALPFPPKARESRNRAWRSRLHSRLREALVKMEYRRGHRWRRRLSIRARVRTSVSSSANSLQRLLQPGRSKENHHQTRPHESPARRRSRRRPRQGNASAEPR